MLAYDVHSLVEAGLIAFLWSFLLSVYKVKATIVAAVIFMVMIMITHSHNYSDSFLAFDALVYSLMGCDAKFRSNFFLHILPQGEWTKKRKFIKNWHNKKHNSKSIVILRCVNKENCRLSFFKCLLKHIINVRNDNYFCLFWC